MIDFILGIFFISYLIPFLDGLQGLFTQAIKHACTWIAVRTYKLEQQIQEPQEVQTNVIGFQIPSTTEEEYYEEEDE